MSFARLTLLLALVLALAARAALAQSDDAAASRRSFRPSALFASDTVVHVTLTADWRALGGDRDTLRARLRPAALSYEDAGAHAVRIPVHVSTRGHFRLAPGQCGFPPLRVVFDSGGVKHTLFAGQRALKLGTHCVTGSTESEQVVVREHLAYRTHNLVTDLSFRTRLARVRYVDARDTTKAFERWGLFIESERELANRLGGKIFTARGGRYADVPDSSAAMLGLWEYFIGNTDFSMGALHNVRLVTTTAGMHPVPYDFDFSGLVDTRYAIPDTRLGIKSVRQRLYRGPCISDADFAPILTRFTARRDAIHVLFDSLPAIDRGYARRATRYLDDFFDEARDPARMARQLRATCVKGS